LVLSERKLVVGVHGLHVGAHVVMEVGGRAKDARAMVAGEVLVASGEGEGEVMHMGQLLAVPVGVVFLFVDLEVDLCVESFGAEMAGVAVVQVGVLAELHGRVPAGRALGALEGGVSGGGDSAARGIG
jgi:hypothetical protein